VSLDFAFDRGDGCHLRLKATRGGRVEAVLMFCDEPVIVRILKDVEIIIGRPFEAGKALVGGERRHNVAANRKFKVQCLSCLCRNRRVRQEDRVRRAEMITMIFRVVLQRVKKALCGSGEIGGVNRRTFLRIDPRGERLFAGATS
jgi:hypothetical protein